MRTRICSMLFFVAIVTSCSMFLACSAHFNHVSQVKQYNINLLALELAGGGTLRFSELDSHVLMVDFFSTWAQASQLTTAAYSVLYQKYHQQGLDVVGVAMDDLGEKVVQPFVAGMSISYPVAIANPQLRSGTSSFGKIEVLPLLLIFDRSRELVAVYAGIPPIKELEKLLQQLLF